MQHVDRQVKGGDICPIYPLKLGFMTLHHHSMCGAATMNSDREIKRRHASFLTATTHWRKNKENDSRRRIATLFSWITAFSLSYQKSQIAQTPGNEEVRANAKKVHLDKLASFLTPLDFLCSRSPAIIKRPSYFYYIHSSTYNIPQRQ